MKKIVFLFILFSRFSFSQEIDTIPFNSYKDRIVAYADIGSNSSHFTLQDNFNLGVNKLHFKHNIKTILGVGFSYKWFAIHLGFALPGNLKSTSKFGNSKYFDLKLRGTYKQIYYYAGLRSYRGFYLKNEYEWNDSLTSFQPNGIYPNLSSSSIEIDVWYFISKKFDMHAVLGRVGNYKRFAQTIYFKNSINAFNINNKSESIIPSALSDSTDRMNANSMGVIELAFIPGYAFVNRFKNWQYSAFGGVGVAFQSSYYIKDKVSRSFTGLAPRFDFRLSYGYNVSDYFIFIEGNYNLRSVKIQSLQYNQSFFNARLIGGYRFKTKSSKRKENPSL